MNKSPISMSRKGVLPKIFNTLFANDLKRDIIKGKSEGEITGIKRIVLREGVDNNSKNSFLISTFIRTLKRAKHISLNYSKFILEI